MSKQREYSIGDKVIDIKTDRIAYIAQKYQSKVDSKYYYFIVFENNTGCYRTGYPDTIQPIDDLLRNGENVFPLATDDAHLLRDCFGGFVMVKAEKLEYETIYNALKSGEFYSSSGPLINELYIEDNIITINYIIDTIYC